MSDLSVFGVRGLPELRTGDDLAGIVLEAWSLRGRPA